MRYRKLTSSGDYSFGNNLQDFYIDVPAAVGQAVQTRILLWLGEWFLDINEGTPFMTGILGKHSKATADSTLQERILGTQGLVDLASYESVIDPETRTMSVTATIDTLYGTTAVELANFVNY